MVYSIHHTHCTVSNIIKLCGSHSSYTCTYTNLATRAHARAHLLNNTRVQLVSLHTHDTKTGNGGHAREMVRRSLWVNTRLLVGYQEQPTSKRGRTAQGLREAY